MLIGRIPFAIREFRKKIKNKYGFPVKLEMHTNKLITDKNPYRDFFWDIVTKKMLLRDYFCMIAGLNIKVINVVINKKNINTQPYEVLDRAFTYNIQRIENDLNRTSDDEHTKFLIITDEGRVGKMRKTSRRVQVINPIPSRHHDGFYRQEIQRLIEDPLPKQSTESYFIQIADFISYFIFLYSLKKFNNTKWANRVENKINFEEVCGYFELIKAVLNLNASRANEFGIVHYPK